MKFASFDKNNLNALRSEMQAVLEKYGVSANLEIEVGNMRFSSAEVEIKLKAKVKGAKTFCRYNPSKPGRFSWHQDEK